LVYASKIIGISEGKKDNDKKCHEELDQEKAQHDFITWMKSNQLVGEKSPSRASW
jgi:hypothetical protein